MKSLKTLLLLFLSLAITGCYTQLQYSKQHKIADGKSTEGYSWDSGSDASYSVNDADSIYMAETKEGKAYNYNEADSYGSDEYGEASYDDDYIPVAYKNYDVVDKYNDCQCDPYKTYVIIEDPYYSPSYGAYSYNGFYNRYYRYYRPYRSHFGFGYYNQGFAFSIGWGSHYHHYSSFYDPYFYPPYYYGYAWYPSAHYNNYYFFGKNYAGSYANRKANKRYGRRSIGTDRLGNRTRSVNTTRSTNRGRATGVTNTRSRTKGVTRVGSENSRTKVTRTRSGGSSRVGNTRSRSSSSRSKVKVNRSRSGEKGKARSRGNTSVTRSSDKNRGSVSRTRVKNATGVRTIDPRNSRSNLRNQRIDLIPKKSNNTRSRSIFGNFGSFFRSSFNTSSNSRSRSYSIPNNKSRSGKSVRSRSSSSSKSSVKRNRSSSGSSKKSRSSGGGDKKRSRGGN